MESGTSPAVTPLAGTCGLPPAARLPFGRTAPRGHARTGRPSAIHDGRDGKAESGAEREARRWARQFSWAGRVRLTHSAVNEFKFACLDQV